MGKLPEKFTFDDRLFTLVSEAGTTLLPINYGALVPQGGVVCPVHLPGYDPFFLGIVEQALPMGQGGGSQQFAFVGFFNTPVAQFSEVQLRQMHVYAITPDPDAQKQDKGMRLAAILLGIDTKEPQVIEPQPFPWPTPSAAPVKSPLSESHSNVEENLDE